MGRILIRDLPSHTGETVGVQGWVQTVRDQKRMQFVMVRDHTGIIQVANPKNAPLAQTISGLTPESVIEVVGTVVSNPGVRAGGMEIQPNEIIVHSMAEVPLPIDERSGLDLRMDWRPLDLRDPKKRLIFEIQTAIEWAMREWWRAHEFIEIHSPKLMGSPSESGAELFSVPYFDGRTAYLAQSPQFYKQAAMAAGFNRVFEIGPVFRANPSFTSRHDTEFTSVDVEVSWVDSHDDVMQLEEEWLQYILIVVNSEFRTAIEDKFGVQVVVPALPFPKISMAGAYNILAQEGHEIPPETGGDLDPAGERKLSEWVRRQYGHEFVFVTDYPSRVRPFYHMRQPDNNGLTRSFDLLWKGLEITTGAQREHRLAVLERQALEKGLTLEGIQSYLNFFRHGMPPHGGLGFGLTRFLMMLTGAANVREVTFLYRGPNRLTP